MDKEKEILFLKSRVMMQELKIGKLLEVSEDLATALLEVDPESRFAVAVIKDWERIRDWVRA